MFYINFSHNGESRNHCGELKFVKKKNILHMFNTPKHQWWQNQSAASSVHSKTTSQERVYTVIVDIEYWQ